MSSVKKVFGEIDASRDGADTDNFRSPFYCF